MYANLETKSVPCKIVLVSLLSLFLFQAGTSMLRKSATWDETPSFGLGHYLLRNFRWDIPGSILHPPLSFYIHSIPFFFSDSHDQGIWNYDSNAKKDLHFLGSADIFRGQALLSSSSNENDKLLNLSRLMVVLVTLFLGCFVYLWSCALYGSSAAILALLFFTFSPNVLAHARLITPDITITTFSFIASYCLWQSLRSCSRKYSILGGVFFGSALLSKYTGLLLFPIYFILLVLWRLKENRFSFRNSLLFFGIGVLILFLGYGFNITPYIQGIIFQLQHAEKGHCSFLLGKHSIFGWWYYFIVAFVIKTPIPTLVLLLLSLLFFVKKFSQNRWIDELFLLIPIGIVFTFFSIKHQSIGLRYILPVYPFIFVFLSRIVTVSIKPKISKVAFSLVVLWYVGGSFHIYPHYLSYFNEFAQGPDGGYRYIVDSNLDWGQDLKGLKKYMTEDGIKKINLSYFGSDSPDRYGIQYNWLPSHHLRNPTPQKSISFPLRGLIGISATNLQGVYFRNKDIYAWLKRYKPVTKIGYSIFVYDIR
jgi:hypothetical protein